MSEASSPFAVDKPILVIGDFCLDVIEEVKSSRLSREEPLPVFDAVGLAETVAGCAGYIVSQLEALGVPIRTANLEPEPMRSMVKTRYVAGSPSRQVFRLDGGWPSRNDTPALDLLCQSDPTTFGLALFVDYQGLPPDGALLGHLRDLDCLLVGDCRRGIDAWEGFDVIKINERDLLVPPFTLPQPRVGSWIVVTAGASGHYLLSADGTINITCPATDAGPPRNVSGAGDVFTATMVAALASGKTTDVERAAALGGIAAGLRVAKPDYGATVSAEEILAWERSHR